MARYIPFPCHADMAPLDISYLFEDEKPAGKHGFLKAEGDRFVFEDGTPVRFWGTNLNAGACFPEKPYAENLAKRLAAYGCNIVRLHQMDAEWGMPNIYRFRRGKRLANTLSYDAEGFFVGQCPIRYENGYAVFNIGGEASSIYSFIQAE